VTTRTKIVEVAVSKLGGYVTGSPEVYAIWRDVLEPATTDAQVLQFAAEAAWCGGFVLHCLRQAGVATDVHWQIGTGFVLRVLRGSSATKEPRPGDIGIYTGKLWHHILVERWNGASDWASIEGNTPRCERKQHTRLDASLTFYNIEKLLPLPEAGFLRGQPFSVPGIQD
jgi:hypothetical protein